MEVTRVFFTIEEKAQWLTDNGYKVLRKDYQEWVSVPHNRSEMVIVNTLAVEFEGKAYKVEDVFLRFFEQHYKKVFTPVNIETQRKIERIIKVIKNGK
jgi:hypothetical protein